MYGTRLTQGRSLSCGCAEAERLRDRSVRHGLHRHPLYRSWSRMKERCYYEKHPYFGRYGGRGIKVCDRWLTFEPFYADNIGRWAPGLTLDRIDNDGGYSPENTRWVPRAAQARNKHNTHLMTLGEETAPLTVWAERLGLSRNVLYLRRRLGWSDEKALTTPHQQPHRTR